MHSCFISHLQLVLSMRWLLLVIKTTYHNGIERKINDDCLNSLSSFFKSCVVQDLFMFYLVFILLFPERMRFRSAQHPTLYISHSKNVL